jgi:TPP-dependent 2-oxoacid decarboxylase
MQKLSDYVFECIRAQGVRHVFLVTGGGAMHLNESLARCTGIEPVCNSHEQASAICAEAYAKATGGLGVALAGWHQHHYRCRRGMARFNAYTVCFRPGKATGPHV